MNPAVEHNLKTKSVCRLCLQVAKKAWNVFQYRNYKLKLLIRDLCAIHLTENNPLPKIICEGCRSKLLVIQKFIDLCKESDEKLRDLYKDEIQIANLPVEDFEEYDDGIFSAQDPEKPESEAREEKIPQQTKFSNPLKLKVFECKVCLRIFPDDMALRTHTKKHCDELSRLKKLQSIGKMQISPLSITRDTVPETLETTVQVLIPVRENPLALADTCTSTENDTEIMEEATKVKNEPQNEEEAQENPNPSDFLDRTIESVAKGIAELPKENVIEISHSVLHKTQTIGGFNQVILRPSPLLPFLPTIPSPKIQQSSSKNSTEKPKPKTKVQKRKVENSGDKKKAKKSKHQETSEKVELEKSLEKLKTEENIKTEPEDLEEFIIPDFNSSFTEFVNHDSLQENEPTEMLFGQDEEDSWMVTVKEEIVHVGEREDNLNRPEKLSSRSKIRCSVCSNTYELENHEKRDKFATVICYKCKESLMRRKKPVPLAPYHCKVCQKTFQTAEKKAHHEKTHKETQIMQFSCMFCPGVFPSFKRFMEHMDTHKN